ncbi:hypothetical protein R1sor_004434 [Riccia sorocarpa]|uniref:Uncharacterized protein n=1 Tax=Riccia sorocarpa TaxID=122646 RepID=A0ABD3HGP2_9MARC
MCLLISSLVVFCSEGHCDKGNRRGLETRRDFGTQSYDEKSYLCDGDTLVVEALQKMVQGKFRHLPALYNNNYTFI